MFSEFIFKMRSYLKHGALSNYLLLIIYFFMLLFGSFSIHVMVFSISKIASFVLDKLHLCIANNMSSIRKSFTVSKRYHGKYNYDEHGACV